MYILVVIASRYILLQGFTSLVMVLDLVHQYYLNETHLKGLFWAILNLTRPI